MKNKGWLIPVGIIVAIALGLTIGVYPMIKKGSAKKGKVSQAPAAQKKAAPQPVKKVISKDMGGLTVKVLNYKGLDLATRIKAFKVVDSKTSNYITTFTSNRMQELAPGSYDLEIDTVPQKIYKNVYVSKGKESVANIGCLTGSISVKTLDAKMKDAFYPVRILYPNSNISVASAMTNKPLEIVAGKYDLEIGTMPKAIKKGIKVDKQKETMLDLGCVSGSLNVKVTDQDGKEMRYSARINKAENNEVVTMAATGRPMELLSGKYNIELLSRPPQAKKDVEIKQGQETIVEFSIQTQAPAAPSKAPAKPVQAGK